MPHKSTTTSDFGTSGRISHDSSKFYSRRLYMSHIHDDRFQKTENQLSDENINRIFCKSCERMDELPDCSIHLEITSPPYNVGKQYDDNLTLDEYLSILQKSFSEVYRVLIPGGRACINVANIGRRPYIPLHSHIMQMMFSIGFLMRGEIIWDKSSSAGTSTAWGSWRSATNPVLRDIHEYIMVFSKESFSRKKGKSTISRNEFLDFTRSVWHFPTESAKKIGHPAPFPVELPYRLIQLYSFEGDIVLDPFIGSGTTAIAAIRSSRFFIGYERKPEYVSLALNRVQNELNHL